MTTSGADVEVRRSDRRVTSRDHPQGFRLTLAADRNHPQVADKARGTWAVTAEAPGQGGCSRRAHDVRVRHSTPLEEASPMTLRELSSSLPAAALAAVLPVAGLVLPAAADPVPRTADQEVVARQVVFRTTEGSACDGEQSVFVPVSEPDVDVDVMVDESWVDAAVVDEGETSHEEESLTVTKDGGEGTVEVTVSADCANLPVGVQRATVEVVDDDATAVVETAVVVNADLPVTLADWRDGHSGAFSVSTDDGWYAGYEELLWFGYGGTFVANGTEAPELYPEMHANGMEPGAHLVSHPCVDVTEQQLRYEIEANVAGIAAATGSLDDVVSLVWPCGHTNSAAQEVASEYFLSARGYHINALEDPTPSNFMNLKSFNSHEHEPYPPEDLRSIVDAAEAEGKWANLVLHGYTNDDGAIGYATTKDVWTAPIGTVVKYILQRDRTVISNYAQAPGAITFDYARLPMPVTPERDFEDAVTPDDLVTFEVDTSGAAYVTEVLVDGRRVPHDVRDGGDRTLFSAPVGLQPRSVTVATSDMVPPVLSVAPQELRATVPTGEGEELSFTVSNAGSGSLTWSTTVEEGEEWLTATPASGSGQGTVLVEVDAGDLEPGTYQGFVRVDAGPGAAGGPVSVGVSVRVLAAGVTHLVLDYANRAELVADGWDFTARTASGGSRDTEVGSGAVVQYSPDGVKVPADAGDVWAGMNNTVNTLFRDLPATWTSVQARVSFAPTANWQQARSEERRVGKEGRERGGTGR